MAASLLFFLPSPQVLPVKLIITEQWVVVLVLFGDITGAL